MTPCTFLRWIQAASVGAFFLGLIIVFALPLTVATPTNLLGLSMTMLGMVLMIATPLLLVATLAIHFMPGLKERFHTCFEL